MEICPKSFFNAYKDSLIVLMIVKQANIQYETDGEDDSWWIETYSPMTIEQIENINNLINE